MGRISDRTSLSLSLLILSGCSLPIHQQPHGFSSTYHNALYGKPSFSQEIASGPAASPSQNWYPAQDLPQAETTLKLPLPQLTEPQSPAGQFPVNTTE